MEILNSLLHTFKLSKPKVDFISELPPEMSRLILRKLDPQSLLRAAQVSRSWLNICQSDSCLKNTARQYKNEKLKWEKLKEIAYLNSASETDIKIKQLKEYYNSCDYTQCSDVYKIVCRIDKFSYQDNLDWLNECSSLQFY